MNGAALIGWVWRTAIDHKLEPGDLVVMPDQLAGLVIRRVNGREPLDTLEDYLVRKVTDRSRRG